MILSNYSARAASPSGPNARPARFVVFVGTIADGSLGHQCPNPETKPTVMSRELSKLPYTIELALGGMLVAILLALPLGIIAAVKRGTWIDASAAVISP